MYWDFIIQPGFYREWALKIPRLKYLGECPDWLEIIKKKEEKKAKVTKINL